MTNFRKLGILPLLFVIAGALVFSSVGFPTMQYAQAVGNGEAGSGQFITLTDTQFDNAFGVTPEEQQGGQQQQSPVAEEEQPATPVEQEPPQTPVEEQQPAQPPVAEEQQPTTNDGADNLNCGDFAVKNFPAAVPDEDKLDNDKDGVACESATTSPTPPAPVEETETASPETPTVDDGTELPVVVDENVTITAPEVSTMQVVIAYLNNALIAYDAGDIATVKVNLCDAITVLGGTNPACVALTEEGQVQQDTEPEVVTTPEQGNLETPGIIGGNESYNPNVDNNAPQQEQPTQEQEQGQQQGCSCQVLGNGFNSLEQVLSPDLIGTEAFQLLENIIQTYKLQIIGDALVVGNVEVQQTLDQSTEQTVNVIQDQIPDNFTQAIENVTEGMPNIAPEDVISNATESAIVEEVVTETGITDEVSDATDQAVTDVITNQTTPAEATQDINDTVTEIAQNTDVTPADVQEAAQTVQQDPSTVYDQLNQAITTLESVRTSLFGSQ